MFNPSFTYSEMKNGNVLIRSWIYPTSNEMDIEVWVDGEYAHITTIDLNKRDEVAW